MTEWLTSLVRANDEGRAAVLVTVTGCAGSTPCAVGAKMVVTDGDIAGTIGGGNLELLAIQDARAAIASGASRAARYPLGATAGQCCGGVVDLFLDVVGAGPSLYLFGAGHVAQALCTVLEGTPFRVQVIDERAEWRARLPKGVGAHDTPWDAFVDAAPWDAARTYVAIMTHRHDVDQAIVGAVAGKPAKYIGLIGSETKWRKLRDRLEGRGVDRSALDRVKCPIGIDVGGKAPKEVAVSIAAELLKTFHGR